MIACPDFDRLADAAASGRPAAQRALDDHAATCVACAAEAVLADDGPAPDLAAALAALRAPTCPPSVVDAALRQARAADRRADRPARAAGRRRTPTWRLGASVLLALATVVAVLTVGDVPHPAPDLLAEVAPVSPDEARTPTRTDPPAPEPGAAGAVAIADAEVRPEAATQPSAPPAERPADPAPDPADLALADLSPPTEFASAEVPADSVALAAEGLQLALAVVGHARQQALSATAEELRRPHYTLTSAILP